MPAIKIRDLHHVYKDKKDAVSAVDHVSLDIEDGEFYTLLGPSGCGKTTMLRCIAGLERPESGSIQLEDAVVVSDRTWVPTHKRNIGMVFQDYAIWPHMSVFENVAFPLRVSGEFSKAEIRARVADSLELMGMTDYIDRRATQLSGGQQQRLSLARALVRDPKVLLLDEPLSNLDAKLRDQMRAELRRLRDRIDMTMIFVTHDQVEALSLSSRIAVMEHGRVVQEGTPRDIYLTPSNRFVAEFVGTISLLNGVVAELSSDDVLIRSEVGDLRCRSAEACSVGDAAVIMVRPESVKVSSERPSGPDNCVEARVDLALFTGDAMDYHLRLGDHVLRAKGDIGNPFRLKERVFVSIPAEACVLLAGADAVGQQGHAEQFDGEILPNGAGGK